MTQLLTIPLFPLNTVLFPTMPLPLHVFEERYKTMINECLDAAGHFGVVLLTGQPEVGAPLATDDWQDIGTLARIVAYDNLPDGRYAVNARGTERFVVERVEQQAPYPVVDVRTLPEDDATSEQIDAEAQRLHALFDRFHQTAQQQGLVPDRNLPVPTESRQLSWFIASILPIEPIDKQRLLTIDDLAERIDAESKLMQACLTRLEEEAG